LDQIISGTAADTMPPLYYFLLHYWMLAGQQVWFIRALTVIISLISLVLLYRLVELWLGKWPAAFAALFAAVSPLLIFHAQDIRMYSLLVFGQIGYVLFFSRLWMAENRKEKKAFIDWAAMVLFGLVAMYSHNLAIFALLVPNLFVVFHKRWRFLLQLMGRSWSSRLPRCPGW
jgi:mannosyltransferase